MDYFALSVGLTLLAMLLIALVNFFAFPKLTHVGILTPHSALDSTELAEDHIPHSVCVLIPARDEADNIGSTVAALLAQEMPNLSLLVLDDDSSDGTAAIARQAANGDLRLRVLAGSPLPAGWLGKNWACHQLAQAASGDVLLFTDADVRWNPGALNALLHLLTTTQADLLTVWPTQLTQSWGERLIVPLMALAIQGYLPVWLVHHTPYPAAAAAVGQCLAFRRTAYTQCGGHAGVRNQVFEDTQLARRIKASGLRLRMADGNGLLQTRMYASFQATIEGYTKNILAGHGNSVVLLGLSTGFHLALFVWPWLWLALGKVMQSSGWPFVPLILIALGVGVRGLTAQATGQRVGDALFMPISALLMSYIALRALWFTWRRGGTQWKGRVIRAE